MDYLDGMRLIPADGTYVTASDLTYATAIRTPHWRVEDRLSGRWKPDTSDPATIGCLLAMVREEHDLPTAYLRPSTTGWSVQSGSGKGHGTIARGKTEGDALMRAWRAPKWGPR